MSGWSVAWHSAVRHDLAAMHPRSAKELVSALERFAETGEGRVEVLGGGRFTLRIEGGVGFLEADTDARSLRVLRVIPTW